ncbi:hypothetical protein QUF74_10410, partial [Candidatus Halobeggiatoa sp. HSG11]|nr:hypothetical protein [Candidatus Halobeggiatoa sp. HSG11]
MAYTWDYLQKKTFRYEEQDELEVEKYNQKLDLDEFRRNFMMSPGTSMSRELINFSAKPVITCPDTSGLIGRLRT